MLENDNVKKELDLDLDNADGNPVENEIVSEELSQSIEEENKIETEDNQTDIEEGQAEIIKTNPFYTNLLKGIIDTGITFIVSGVLLLITNVILKYIFGYYIVDLWGMLFIMFLITSVFYPTFKDKIKVPGNKNM